MRQTGNAKRGYQNRPSEAEYTAKTIQVSQHEQRSPARFLITDFMEASIILTTKDHKVKETEATVMKQILTTNMRKLN